MKTLNLVLSVVCVSSIFVSCKQDAGIEKEKFIKENVEFATAQTEKMLETTGEPTGKNYPRTMRNDSTLAVTGMYDWTPGFFPGSLWYLYELTGETKWKEIAEKWTVSLEPLKTHTGTHDLGFMMYCSYGNAERLASKPEYKDILIESAESLSTRFSDKTQVIKSWNRFKSWNDTIRYDYPVIIDNMMNLEMLFYASKASGDKKYYDIAVSHADMTLKNHFREDFSTYHVVSYDTVSTNVLSRNTAQGFSDNSTWSRGQAWAIYGFTMVYRETKDPKYLDAAIKATDYYLKNLPTDLVPLWDFNVGQDGYVTGDRSYAKEFQEKLRDASAAAIVCSALFELGEAANNPAYTDTAVKMLHSLASPQYRATLGSNANFIIMHCVGSIPHKAEIDKPLVYADYYFLEALVRYKKMMNI
ncbi:rhamnogalacturonyl hydrolase YesR [Dysgonomonas hofstadii]|uniref:Rhamnogalacturonyl hydrolase YesR n=1 Tax=Dysgonomonas hofstadii TaxID=637886 RepID=A0A840CLY4_9BACT|nr:glycoside hydrolase family 88 protein [Dysgonomonas hofstadii]MBB4036131.1 rhamnogalacturonyl hydrolase YesR [Dysgonomonas hofstadii]